VNETVPLWLSYWVTEGQIDEETDRHNPRRKCSCLLYKQYLTLIPAWCSIIDVTKTGLCKKWSKTFGI